MTEYQGERHVRGYDPQTGQPIYETYQQPRHQASHAAPAYAAPTKAKKGGGVKTFFISFIGAALACCLVLVGYNMLATGTVSLPTPASSGSNSSSTELGAPTSTDIMVEGESTTLAEAVAAKCTPSVCCIYVYSQQSSGYYGSITSSGTLAQSSLGSGVILSEDGYVLTNYHVVEGAAALKVSVAGGEYDATIIGSDESSDLAVIKLNDAPNLTPMELGDSDKLTIGEWVMTIGSPFGLEQSVATGIVSATSRSQLYNNNTSYGSTGAAPTVYANMIQTDAAINPGNSGGALVNAGGKLIGINTLITSYSGNYSGVGFAIPVNYAVGIAQQIIDGKAPSHAQLGVSLVSVTPSLAKRYNLPVEQGAYLSAVNSGSAADQAGMQVGDIITNFGGKAINSSNELLIAVREKSVGDKVEVTFNREGKEQTVTVTLGSDTESGTPSALLQQNSGKLQNTRS